MGGMMHLGQLFHVANTTRLAIPLRPGEWLEDRRTRMENGLKTLARAARNGTISGDHQHATSEGLDVYASEPDPQSLKITIRNGLTNIEEHRIKDDTLGE